jgi:hypothetical protein
MVVCGYLNIFLANSVYSWPNGPGSISISITNYQLQNIRFLYKIDSYIYLLLGFNMSTSTTTNLH